MKQFIFRAALPAALLFGATELSAQADTTRKPVVRDSAAGMLATDSKAQFGRLMAALNTLDTNASRFNAISGITAEQIVLVDVRNLMQGNNQVALEEAVARRERELTSMRNSLQNSLVLRDLLTSRDIPMVQVLAVDVAPDGKSATVFYRPE
jgi:hypothetical protein